MWYKFQKLFRCLSAAGFCYLLFFSARTLNYAIPDEINVIAGEEEALNFHVPVTGTIGEESTAVFSNLTESISSDNRAKIHFSAEETIQTEADTRGSFHILCRFLGILPVKEVTVNVVPKQEVVPAGMPIGIYTKTDGILIIGTGTVTAADGLNYEPAYDIVKSGDYIETLNTEPVNSKEELIEKINQYGENPIILGIRRDGEALDIKLRAVCVEQGQYKLGIWVRDDMAGVGTMTYYSSNLDFGALGHPISDADTSTIVEMREGKIYDTDIVGVVKGENGIPGELTGIINYSEEYCFGEIAKNTQAGIYGKLYQVPEAIKGNETYPVGFKQEIVPGEASIISSFDGERKEYGIVIDHVEFNSKEENKGILFHVTDQELLGKTGGIVQGMSGSPMIQNGKIIGAVTHVFVSNATKGYGIFLENMLEQ